MSILEIKSNGNKWAGEAPDTITELLNALKNYTLDPTFEKFGNFVQEFKPREWTYENEYLKGCTSFFGNFRTYSHVFNIITDDVAIIDQLTDAIRSNQETSEYKEYRAEMQRIDEINKTLPYNKRLSF